MKLHYFNQPAADPDDTKLQTAIRIEAVPATCLLGGILLEKMVMNDIKPCDGCHGPRDRCRGTPEKKDWESETLDFTRGLLTGDADGPIQELLRRRING